MVMICAVYLHFGLFFYFLDITGQILYKQWELQFVDYRNRFIKGLFRWVAHLNPQNTHGTTFDTCIELNKLYMYYMGPKYMVWPDLQICINTI